MKNCVPNNCTKSIIKKEMTWAICSCANSVVVSWMMLPEVREHNLH